MADEGDDSGVSGSAVTGAIGGVASAIPALFGRGQNKRTASGFVGQPGYDPNAGQYGGYKGGLQNYTNDMNLRAAQVQQRGPNLADYSGANSWENAQLQGRNGQMVAANAQLQTGLGNTPTIASQQAANDSRNLAATQQGQAASARGAAGLALAGQTAANNTQQGQAQISNQAQVNSASERLNDLNAASAGYGQIRGGDQQAQGQQAQQQQFQAQQQQGNVNENDAQALGYQNLVGQANGAALNGGVANQGVVAGSYNAANVANQTSGNQNAGSKGIIQTLGDFFSSDERAKVPLLSLGGAQQFDVLGDGGGLVAGTAKPAYAMTSGGGMDVNATGKQQGLASTGYGSNPAAPMLSDERTKYETPLSGDDEKRFQSWKAQYAPRDSGGDYDLRGAYTAGIKPDPKTAHWPDTFKKPNHPTFSDESQYADDAPAKAGHWTGEVYTPASKTMLSRGGRGPRGEGVPDRDAPHASFDPVHGWTIPGQPAPSPLDAGVTARQAEQDAADADIMRQVAERQQLDAKLAKDPAVGLDRIAQDRKMIRKSPPSDANAQRDAATGMAPGTADFETTQPKTTQPKGKSDGGGGAPWWASLGAMGANLSQAQFGDGSKKTTMLSDETAKRAVYLAGRSHGAESVRNQNDAPYIFAPLGKGEELVETAPGKPEIRHADIVEEPMGMTDKERAGTPQSAGKWPDAPDMSGQMLRGMTTSGRGEIAPPWASAKTNIPTQPGGPIAGMQTDSEGPTQDSAAPAGRMLARGGSRSGPDLSSAIADANRAMRGAAYAYKPGMTPPEQKPGEANFGPMAQNMEKNPITATAIKTDPSTGLKVIDKDKALKVTMAGLADLQAQNDDIKKVLAAGGRR